MPFYPGICNDFQTGQCGTPTGHNIMYTAYYGGYSNNCGTEPDPKKFEDKWFDGGDPESEFDILTLSTYEKQANFEQQNEKFERHMKKHPGWRMDNVYWRHYMIDSSQMTMPRGENRPHFCDFNGGPQWEVSSDALKMNINLMHTYNHCVGNLGADHPTCLKAHWYWSTKGMQNGGLGKAFFEEYAELGHYDTARRWGLKHALHWLPMYQPIKKNIPGAYEYYNCESYLKNHAADGTGAAVHTIMFKD